MKKSSLTTAVLAGLVGVVGFAGSSSAVELNPDGTGQVLIYPYYTARAGQQTLISVVNSTDTPQAVKVRFLEGYASKEVLDFNLFLSAYDVWTGTVFKLSDAGIAGDGAAVGTRDNSCTVPNFSASNSVAGMLYQPFSNQVYTENDPDLGPQGTDRTNEGYVELIDMTNIGDENGTATDITHVDGVPPGCDDYALLNDATNPDLQITPTGGLFGNGSVINVADGTQYAYTADAVDGWTATPQFTESGSLAPDLSKANSPSGGAVAYVFQGGVMTTVTYPPGQEIDAVSAVFDASALMNTWVANAAAGQGTDWVVTFPTKRYYVNDQTLTDAIPPFAEVLDSEHDGASCTQVGLNIYDREEGAPTVSPTGPVFSPRPNIQTVYTSLCHEVNVISISDPADPMSILGSQYENAEGSAGLAVNMAPFGTAGWLDLDLYDYAAGNGEYHVMRGDVNGTTFLGLPATGFAAERFINATATTSNYAGAFRHRVERMISSTAP
ncbi:MAG TPA: hypothetical protein VFG73_09905 [Rhodanobacteraceae bacterium]|nr:hypothetical protein [Rhodanobacteraceae bacterium]